MAQYEVMRGSISSLQSAHSQAETRQLQFFSLLVPAGLVSSSTLLEVYRSLLSVLSEFGGGGDRADRVVRAVGEGLMRVS